MTDSKHTPGPWIVERPYGEPGLYVSAADPCRTNPIICKMYPIERVGRLGDHEANARLIAAAPDLLEAVKERSERAAECGDTETHNRLEGLIAKATGNA